MELQKIDFVENKLSERAVLFLNDLKHRLECFRLVPLRIGPCPCDIFNLNVGIGDWGIGLAFRVSAKYLTRRKSILVITING